MLETILTDKIYNQKLFDSFDTLKDYCIYLLHVRESNDDPNDGLSIYA